MIIKVSEFILQKLDFIHKKFLQKKLWLFGQIVCLVNLKFSSKINKKTIKIDISQN